MSAAQRQRHDVVNGLAEWVGVDEAAVKRLPTEPAGTCPQGVKVDILDTEPQPINASLALILGASVAIRFPESAEPSGRARGVALGPRQDPLAIGFVPRALCRRALLRVGGVIGASVVSAVLNIRLLPFAQAGKFGLSILGPVAATLFPSALWVVDGILPPGGTNARLACGISSIERVGALVEIDKRLDGAAANALLTHARSPPFVVLLRSGGPAA